MSDIERLDKIIASQARTEAVLNAVQKDVSELKEHTNTRMNAHASSIRSLNKTRDRQWGATKVIGILSTASAIIIGWFKYG